MQQNHFDMVALISVPPEDVYAVLADYRHGHPHILPAKYISQFKVEANGQGAGTVLRYRMRIFGFAHERRALVSEPEPGRILVERETTTSLVTTYAVTPANNGLHAHVQIAAHWEPAHTLAGKLEQAFYPSILRKMFTYELDALAKLAARKKRVASSH
ncbi:polyketide cyclase [Dictyobacter alpinus]|uniref:Polyketide cyclase n=1 Tax=Dictyobacter alpinus TaxID=2014873 RepID=A0A402BHR4_9CHLR|nr:SRPBCC family protein [Dictyobacter alpinus]GCE30905.1 polyketide cyclase [Dictyobacter alpinus]